MRAVRMVNAWCVVDSDRIQKALSPATTSALLSAHHTRRLRFLVRGALAIPKQLHRGPVQPLPLVHSGEGALAAAVVHNTSSHAKELRRGVRSSTHHERSLKVLLRARTDFKVQRSTTFCGSFAPWTTPFDESALSAVRLSHAKCLLYLLLWTPAGSICVHNHQPTCNGGSLPN